MRVGIYARVSTSDKDQDPTTQLLPLREFVAAQGWTAAREYVDHASATDLRGRTAWRELLAQASRRRVDLVLCWKLDRCFRSTLHAVETLEKLRGWGVGLRSYTEPWADSTSAAGELMFTIATAFAAFERSLIRERVRSGMDRARRQGKHVGRPRKLNGEWETVKALIVSGELSQGAAAKRLGVSRSTVHRAIQAAADCTLIAARGA
jgi:DNA invertase Pin-like site-specific DNA recombinase